MTEEKKLEMYWCMIPIGKENALEYPELMSLWGKNERQVRAILHELSCMDNGDNYVLVRSGSMKGFYRTDDTSTLSAYRSECLSKGKSIFAPVKKINRILRTDTTQYRLDNNLRVIREGRGMKQSEVCKRMREYDRAIDKSMLSKFENSVCLPTPFQLAKLAEIYGCTELELLDAELYK